MYAIIMGGGRVGLALANLLIDSGADITLIENDESLCNEIASELDALVIHGNGTNSKMLEEINIEDAYSKSNIIANPNCSTIQSVLPLKPLLDTFGLKRVVYTTYQSVSGSGQKGVNDLQRCKQGENPEFYPYDISNTCIPEIDEFLDDGYTKEEMKMVNETRKILHNDAMRVTATTVRVPVFDSHSESINVEFEKPFELDELIEVLKNAPGVVVQNDSANNEYPMAVTAAGKDEVFIGRIRRDESLDSGVNLWVVADNIRKGAATNAVQIAEEIIKNMNA